MTVEYPRAKVKDVEFVFSAHFDESYDVNSLLVSRLFFCGVL